MKLTLKCFPKHLAYWISLVFRGQRDLPPEINLPKPFSDGKLNDTDVRTLAPGAVVFLGDSITYLGNFSKAFPLVLTSNQGVGGNTTEDVLKRIGPILASNPSKIFLRVGINDLQAGILPCEYEKTYTQLVNAILTNPSANKPRLYLLPICPIGKPFDAYHKNIRARIRNYNMFIMSVASKNGLAMSWDYSDLVDSYSWLRKDLWCDGIHLSPKGYEMVFASLRSYV
jgi:lysophospholipase L1-like esterase